MCIRDSIQDGAQIVTVNCRLVEGKHVRALVDAVSAGLDQGIRKFVVDMTGADWINSAGVSALVKVHRIITEQEGRLLLARVSPKVEHILTITKLARVFTRRGSVEEALAALE